MPETGKQCAFDLESSFGEALSFKSMCDSKV